jgi:hypothetical protein
MWVTLLVALYLYLFALLPWLLILNKSFASRSALALWETSSSIPNRNANIRSTFDAFPAIRLHQALENMTSRKHSNDTCIHILGWRIINCTMSWPSSAWLTLLDKCNKIAKETSLQWVPQSCDRLLNGVCMINGSAYNTIYLYILHCMSMIIHS